MQIVETLDKRTIILDAAFKVFLAYGFRRTTMADIAEAAGISRPALYLEFKNKADIYRAGFRAMIDRTFRDVEQALTVEAPVCERLKAALTIGVIEPMRKVQQSPHGAELFEVKQEIAEDLGEDWNTVLEKCLERAISKAAANGEIHLEREQLDPSDLARLIVAGVEGTKKRMDNWPQAEADITCIVRLMMRTLM